MAIKNSAPLLPVFILGLGLVGCTPKSTEPGSDEIGTVQSSSSSLSPVPISNGGVSSIVPEIPPLSSQFNFSSISISSTNHSSSALSTANSSSSSSLSSPDPNISSSNMVANFGTAGCGNLAGLQSGTHTILVDALNREFILDIPTNYNPAHPYRLIFGWHWLGGNASQVSGSGFAGGFYGLKNLSQNSAIFVAPNGIDGGWPNTGGRDIAFLRRMLDTLKNSLCLDTTRFFSTGFSYGGMMSNTVGCNMAEQFRALAPMAGAIMGGCRNANSIAAMVIHGTGDTIVSYSSGQQSLESYRTRNGCSQQTTPIGNNGCIAYQGCAAGKPLVWCSFAGGHNIPRFSSQEIWGFFNQF